MAEISSITETERGIKLTPYSRGDKIATRALQDAIDRTKNLSIIVRTSRGMERYQRAKDGTFTRTKYIKTTTCPHHLESE